MRTRKLGKTNLEVSVIGYGCMGLSHGYGVVPERNDSIKLIRQAYELGCNFFDTAEGYGAGDNERIVGDAIRPIRDHVILATKFGRSEMVDGVMVPKVYSPQEIRFHLEASLKRLGTDHIDLYYEHRVSSENIEEVAYCMGEFIKEGKILGWGQSQVTKDQIRRAHAVTPLTAIQSEYSMMERMFERDVIPTCGELGISFIPFSPLASGFLSGKIKAGMTYAGDDVRRGITRFKDENIIANQPLVDLLQEFSVLKNVTPAQLSLAWMLRKYDFLIPIPGTKKLERLRENLSVADVDLAEEEFTRIEAELAEIDVQGNRTDEDIANLYR